VNWSALEVAEVPAGVVTVTSTSPAEPAGEVQPIEVSPSTKQSVAATEPNMTEVAPVNPDPVMDTFVPPSVDPDVGLTPVTVGRAARLVVVVVGATVVVGAGTVVVVGGPPATAITGAIGLPEGAVGAMPVGTELLG